MKTIEIHEARELKTPSSQLMFNKSFTGKKLPEFSVIGKQAWLKINPSGKIERVVKTIEWKLGFDVDTYAEDFVTASLSGDFSKLPDIIVMAKPSKAYTSNNLSFFAEEVLGIDDSELKRLQSLAVEDVGSGWRYDFFAPNESRWTSCGMHGESRYGTFT